MSLLKPMLAGKAPEDLEKLVYPLLASPKLDGIRCLVVHPGWYKTHVTYQPKHFPYICRAQHALAVSRTLKPIPNEHIQFLLDHPELVGLDGELIVGDPTAKDVYRKTDSAVMRIKGQPDFCFNYFDNVTRADAFAARYEALKWRETPSDFTRCLHHTSIYTPQGLEDAESEFISQGYEGVILRAPQAPYKYGRSMTKQGWMLKLKRFKDSEAQIIGFEERFHNANDAILDELGYTKRSSHQENKIPTGTLGAFIVKDIHDPSIPEFKIGTGFTAQQALNFWVYRNEYIAKIVKYKHIPYGIKDKPRHAVFLGLRHLEDIV